MSEENAVVADPFQGQEPSFAEYTEYRNSGKLPERFSPAEQQTEVAPVTPEKEVETAEGKEPSPVEQEKQQDRDESGKFKGKEKEPLFTADQQKAFDNAFKRREAKLRREFDEQIAAIKSSSPQGTAPAKEPTKEAAASEPAPPEIPDITTFNGTAEEFQKELKDYPAKLAAYLDAKRQTEEAGKSLQKKLADSEKRVLQEHPEFKQLFDELIEDVKSGEEPQLPQHVLKAIAEDADDPHAITYYLASNREEYRRFSELNPVQALKEVLKLEVKLQGTAKAPAQEAKPRQTSAPAPPEPVAARVTAKRFDVNDESLSPDEWAKGRNEQVHKRR